MSIKTAAQPCSNVTTKDKEDTDSYDEKVSVWVIHVCNSIFICASLPYIFLVNAKMSTRYYYIITNCNVTETYSVTDSYCSQQCKVKSRLY